MLLDDLPGDGQPYARARIRFDIDALEHAEDAVPVPGIDSDPVVTHREHPDVVVRNCGYVNFGSGLAPELDRVVNQACQYVDHLVWIAVQLGKRIVGHHGFVAFYRLPD